MREKVRKTGIDVIGNVPWGTHFCQFYETKEDLIDILAPYFKAGLENNEFCMWITSEPLHVEDAKRALKEKVKDLDDYIEKGQIEILDYRQWYTRSGHFDSDQVLEGWVEKERQALERGFDGLRLTGNTFWLEKKDWESFKNYEAAVNSVIGKYRMLAVCTYSLDKCTASEIIDVVSNHQFALVKRQDNWEIIESAEHKKTSEALWESESRYRAIVQDQTELICRFLPDKTLTFVNRAYCRYFGKKPQELVGHKFIPLIPKEDREKVEKHFASFSPENPVATHEHRVIAPDGKIYWQEWTNRAIYDEQDNLVEFQNVGRDITDRKDTIDVLRISEVNYHAIFDSVNDAIFVHDIESGKILSVNKKACEMFGYAREELEKLTVDDLSTGVSPYDQQHAVEWIKKVAKEGPQLFEWVCKNKTGQNFWVEVNLKLAVLKGEDRMLAIIRDITDRKRAKDALRESEERYSLAQKAANIGSWDCDILTGQLVWSEQIEPMFGFDRGEFGRTYEAFLDCVHPGDRQHVIDSVNACVEEGKNYAIEHRIVWPNGTVRWVSETGDVVRDENGKAVRMVGIVRDISERKDAESRQLLAGRILERLNKTSEAFAMVTDIVTLVKEHTGFAAVGVRLREGDDFPYFVVNGFSNDFVKAENYLCAHDESGELIFDAQGRPILECMCGASIMGFADQSLSFFTEAGSFWTNSTTELLASPEVHTLQIPTRNRCNQAGYESVALIPLRSGEVVVGLLQLNDRPPGRFTPEMIRFFEWIGGSIGIGLARIKAEERLMEALQKSESLVGAVGQIIYEHYMPENKVMWQGKYKEILGYTKEEMGHSTEEWLEKAHPDDLKAVKEELDKAIKGAKIYNLVYRFRYKSGDYLWFHNRGVVTHSPDGKSFSIIGLMEDIAERKQAEEALKAHELRLQSLLDLNKMVIASQQEILDFVREEVIKITQSQFAFIGFMNYDESVMRINNWSKETMPKCAVIDKPMHFPIAEAGLWGEAVRQRKPIVINDYNAPNPRKKGYPKGHVPIKRYLGIPVFEGERIVAVAAVANKKKDYEESDVRAVTSMVNDMWRLIQRKRAQEQIENLAKFPSENPNPVLRIAEDGTILYANESSSPVLKLWKCQQGGRISGKWHRIIQEILSTGKLQEIEGECGDKTYLLTFSHIKDTDFVNVYGLDITERKQAEEELSRHRNRLEELVLVRTEELRQINEQLLQEIEERRRLEKEVLEISEEEQRRMGRALHDGLQQELVGMTFDCQVLAKKLTAKSLPEANSAVRIHKLLNEAIGHTRDVTRMLYPIDLDSNDLTFALQELATRVKSLFYLSCLFKCKTPPAIHDPMVVINLYRIAQEAVTNAIKHGKANRIIISLDSNKNRITLTVKDNGIGFAVDSAEDKGMGLRIMKYRSSVIGALLDVKSNTKDHGTVVTCSFENKDNKL